MVPSLGFGSVRSGSRSSLNMPMESQVRLVIIGAPQVGGYALGRALEHQNVGRTTVELQKRSRPGATAPAELGRLLMLSGLTRD
jgi:hypothetical protein